MATSWLFDPDRSNARIADLWWAMALRGVGAIVLGSLAVLWPGITLLVLAGIFAAYCVVDAAFSIVLAIQGARRHESWGWPALHGVIALAAGGLAALCPGRTVLAFVMLLSIWALATGAVSIVGAFRLKGGQSRGWMILAGIVSLAFGGSLLLFPQMGLLTLTWMIAFQAWLMGAMLLSLAYRLRMRHDDQRWRGNRGADQT